MRRWRYVVFPGSPAFRRVLLSTHWRFLHIVQKRSSVYSCHCMVWQLARSMLLERNARCENQSCSELRITPRYVLQRWTSQIAQNPFGGPLAALPEGYHTYICRCVGLPGLAVRFELGIPRCLFGRRHRPLAMESAASGADASVITMMAPTKTWNLAGPS